MHQLFLLMFGTSSRAGEEFPYGLGQQEMVEFRHRHQAVDMRLDLELIEVPAKAHVLDPQLE
ncbi:hypothetical protein PTW37_16640 (plasmid) [Arthrobacter agilis]|uniref:hypothetical protein n=1 Tax=Arthrobacter agilis TaxID=37921 RepID=UPI0023654762|nr:hypothetical protein [Arthrobacter agilis]WDF35128.1 hypothetical protein PTW37_16640 [Arthrobacter agilis]